MTLDLDAARAAVERDVADPLGLDLGEAAWGIERIVNAGMADATRRVLASHGADPHDLALIAYGGNGGVHAWAIAAELGIDRILVPRTAPAFSALGVLVADYLVDLVRAYVVPLSQVDVARLAELARELEGEAAKELAPAGPAGHDVEVAVYAQMCYPGQNFDMSVPFPEHADPDDTALLDLAARFHDLHRAERGFSFEHQEPVLRGVRLTARACTPKPARLAAATGGRPGDRPVGEPDRVREVHFGTGPVNAAVHDGAALAAGTRLDGPALVQEPFTVVVVPPGASVELDERGNYELHLHAPA